MSDPFREILLPNSLKVRFFDTSHRYYGDFYLVKLDVTCEVPLEERLFGTPAEYAEARRLMGDTIEYRRSMEQMGVPSTEIHRVRERLIEHFSQHSLPYFTAPNFAARLVRAELAKIRRRSPRGSIS